MVKIYVAMLFTTLVAFQISGLYQEFDSFEFDQVNANVQDYADNTAGLYQSGLTSIVNTVSGTIDVANGFVDAILFIPNLFGLDNIIDGCIESAEDIPFWQRINYESSLLFWRLFNQGTPDSVYLAQWATNNGYTGVCA